MKGEFVDVGADRSALSTAANLQATARYLRLADQAVQADPVRDLALAVVWAQLAGVHATAAMACATRDAGRTQ